MDPKVTVVVLNWNRAQDTRRCIESLLKVTYPHVQILIVDNGSTDGSVGLLRGAFPGIDLIETGENLGYAGGNNVGVEWALKQGAEFVVLLNNDTVVDPHFLEPLVEAAQKYPKAGFLGSKILYLDRPDVVWFGGGRVDWMNGVSHVGQESKDEPSEGDIRETDYITGCCLMVRAVALQSIGLMDSRFFLLFEETDWCVRARQLGWQVVYVPTSRVWHAGSQSFGGYGSPTYRYYYARNELLLYWIHLRGKRRVRALLNAHRRDLNPRRYLSEKGWIAQMRHVLLGIWHFWIGRYGRL